MSGHFIQKGKWYEVITHPNFRQTMDGRPHLFHFFEQGTLVKCTKVIPKGPNNLYGRLAGVFESPEGVDQELSTADVKVYKGTKQ